MNKALFLIVLLTYSINSFAQLDCEKTMDCRIIAQSGLIMREKPSLNSKVLSSVPYDTVVEACAATYGEMNYEKISGHWRKVTHRNKVGFMFDGFMEIISIHSNLPEENGTDDSLAISTDSLGNTQRDTVETTKPFKKEMQYTLLTEAYNYCGDVSKLDPGLLWYGIYPPEENEPYGRIEEVEVDIVLSKQKLGKGLEFDIQTQKEAKSIFLIGLNQPLPLMTELIMDPSEHLRAVGRRIYPGQELRLGINKNYPKLSATGSVISTGDCPELENYSLVLKGKKFAIDFEQPMLEEIGDPGDCGMPEIFWYGDLNGDEIPEIIFVSVSEEKNLFTLFVSDPSHPQKFLVKKSEWIIPNCN